MAQGDKKRTYKLTESGVRVIDTLDENTRLDKSDVVDRAVKYYYQQVKEGNIDSALVEDSVERIAQEVEGDGDDSGIGLMERLRKKK